MDKKKYSFIVDNHVPKIDKYVNDIKEVIFKQYKVSLDDSRTLIAIRDISQAIKDLLEKMKPVNGVNQIFYNYNQNTSNFQQNNYSNYVNYHVNKQFYSSSQENNYSYKEENNYKFDNEYNLSYELNVSGELNNYIHSLLTLNVNIDSLIKNLG